MRNFINYFLDIVVQISSNYIKNFTTDISKILNNKSVKRYNNFSKDIYKIKEDQYKISGVYILIFKNGDSYIGSSENISKRLGVHLTNIINCKEIKFTTIYIAGDAIIVLILEIVPPIATFVQEQHYISTISPTLNTCNVKILIHCNSNNTKNNVLNAIKYIENNINNSTPGTSYYIIIYDIITNFHAILDYIKIYPNYKGVITRPIYIYDCNSGKLVNIFASIIDYSHYSNINSNIIKYIANNQFYTHTNIIISFIPLTISNILNYNIIPTNIGKSVDIILSDKNRNIIHSFSSITEMANYFNTTCYNIKKAIICIGPSTWNNYIIDWSYKNRSSSIKCFNADNKKLIAIYPSSEFIAKSKSIPCNRKQIRNAIKNQIPIQGKIYKRIK